MFLWSLYLLSALTVFLDKKDLYKKIFFLQAVIRDLLSHGFLLCFICISLDSYGQCLSNELRKKSMNVL